MTTILILTGKFGNGHISVSNTLAEKIKKMNREANVIIEDVFESITPRQSQLIYDSFSLLVNKGSKVYNLFYLGTQKSREATLLHSLIRPFTGRIHEMIESVRPDVVISTMPISSQMFSVYKGEYSCNVPLITCITDISSHPYWLSDMTNAYLVGSDDVKQELVAKGVHPKRIFVIGIPVKEAFKKQVQKSEGPDKHLLIMGGGLGLLPGSVRFYEELNRLPQVKTTIITGNNKKLYEKLHGKYENIEVLGYSDRISDFMKQADLMVTKPGGITMFEAIESELPLLVFRPFLQQEVDNAKFLYANNLGSVLPKRNRGYVRSIQALLENEPRLNEMRRSMCRMKESLNDNLLADVLSRCMRKEASAS